MPALLLRLQEGVEAVRRDMAINGWNYIFGFFIWLLCWYTSMVVLSYIYCNSRFPIDYMPTVAGVPILLIGWQAVALRRKLNRTIEGFDDGAAFVFPVGHVNAKQAFLKDVRATVARLSRQGGYALTGATLVIAMGVSIYRWITDGRFDEVEWSLVALLIVGLPVIGLPIGIQFGQLVGYGQLPRILARHKVELAGLSTPPAQEALRGLNSIYSFAIATCAGMAFWFAAWWIWWGLGQDWSETSSMPPYQPTYGPIFQTLWLVSLVLFAYVGVIPAWQLRQRITKLEGGDEGRRALDDMVRQAVTDLQQLELIPAKERNLVEQKRIAELHEFITNSSHQNVGSWLLNPVFHAFVIAANIAIRLYPWSPLPRLLPDPPFYCG